MNNPSSQPLRQKSTGHIGDYQMTAEMRERFLPCARNLPVPQLSGKHVFFDGSIEERLAGIRGISP